MPQPITSCWLSWLAIPAPDHTEVISAIGLTRVSSVSWPAGVKFIDGIAHDSSERFSKVLVTPSLGGWVLVVGPWCGLPYLNRTADVTRICLELSARYGRAQAYFYGERLDGDAWLIAERGTVTRRWISEYPELALGEPFGLERRSLDAIRITGRPEDLDPDEAVDLLDDWDCSAPDVAQELSLDPRRITATGSASCLVIAVPPETQLTDPFAHSSGTQTT
jgi:hypothetical protein